MRLIVADDALLVREGLARLLAQDGHEVVATASRPESVPALVAKHAPDVLLVDIKMPPTFSDEGLLLASSVRAHHPAVGVLVLSQYVVAAYVTWLLDRSPERIGYLLKDNVLDAAVLDDALTRVCAGGTFVDPQLVSALLSGRTGLSVLSAREREVLGLLAEGLSDLGVAQRLHLSLNTVSTYGTSSPSSVCPRVRATTDACTPC